MTKVMIFIFYFLLCDARIFEDTILQFKVNDFKIN